jgi:hypothetical protein
MMNLSEVTLLYYVVLATLLVFALVAANKWVELNEKTKAQATEITKTYTKLLNARNEVTNLENVVTRLDYLLGQSMPLDQGSGRRTGKTTRLIAHTVDQLFRDPHHTVSVPMNAFENMGSKNYFISRLSKRLRFEHDVILKATETKEGLTLRIEQRLTEQSKHILENQAKALIKKQKENGTK